MAATRLSATLFLAMVVAAPVCPVHAQAPDTAAASTPGDSRIAAPPEPAEPSISAGADLIVASAYVWRGFVPTDRVSYQPTSWVKLGDLTVSSWFNVAGGQPGGPMTEHDLTVGWAREVGSGWTLSGGWINYVFPGAAADRVSNEFYAGVAHAGPLNPTVKVYQDVSAGSGTYISLGASHTLSLPNGIAATPGVTVGYNHRQWIDASTWSDATVNLTLSIPTPHPRLALAPFVAYTHGLDEALFPSTFYGGIGVSVR